jgi:hypothetical protein
MASSLGPDPREAAVLPGRTIMGASIAEPRSNDGRGKRPARSYALMQRVPKRSGRGGGRIVGVASAAVRCQDQNPMPKGRYIPHTGQRPPARRQRSPRTVFTSRSISSIDIGSMPASATRSAIAKSASAACRRLITSVSSRSSASDANSPELRAAAPSRRTAQSEPWSCHASSGRIGRAPVLPPREICK